MTDDLQSVSLDMRLAAFNPAKARSALTRCRGAALTK